MQAPEAGGEVPAFWAWLQISCFRQLLSYRLHHQQEEPQAADIFAQQPGHKRASKSMEAQVDDFADLLVLEHDARQADPAAKEDEKVQALADQISSLVDVTQMWQKFFSLLESGRTGTACELLVRVQAELGELDLTRSAWP